MDQLGNAIDAPLLITGSRGYLGGRIAGNLVRRGIDATGITRNDVDLTNLPGVRQHIPIGSTIIHCAAVVPKTASDYDADDAAKESLRMVDALLERAPRHFIFISSMTVYTASGHPVREEEASNDLTGYAAGKRRAEQRVETSGVTATILRLPGLFGPPRRNGFLFNTVDKLVRGDTVELPDNPPLWAALHVDDAAEMAVRATLRQDISSCRTINIGYSHVFSLSRALTDIAGVLDLDLSVSTANSPEFSMDLTRMHAVLGATPGSWQSRIQELVTMARETQC